MDVSIQAQILNLLADLRERLGLTYIVISHDLAVVRHVAEECLVMYRGTVVESGDVTTLLTEPRHPYTQRLVASVPRPGMALEVRTDRSSLETLPGCVFRGRCPSEHARCSTEPPLLTAHAWSRGEMLARGWGVRRRTHGRARGLADVRRQSTPVPTVEAARTHPARGVCGTRTHQVHKPPNMATVQGEVMSRHHT